MTTSGTATGAGAARLSELETGAERLLSVGRPDLEVLADLDQLLILDFADHRWARLVVAAALTDVRDERAAAWLAESLAAFEMSGDARGIGFACFITGHHHLNGGRLVIAAEWYQRSRQHLQAECAVDAADLAHSGLGAYQRGELAEAIAITDEALALARLRGIRRYEGLACMYLAFFLLTSGSFGRVDNLLDEAEATYLEMADPTERYELPLVLAARGVLKALRGQSDQSDEQFAAALEAARTVQEPWFVAIVQSLRAEFTARVHPTRSVADARLALEQLVAMGDAWWQTWAIRAGAVAARESGHLETSRHVLEQLLQRELNPLERGLTLLALAETMMRTDQPARAVEPVEAALGLLEPLGAWYWVARCYMVLAKAGPPGGSARQRAATLVNGDLAYQHLLAGPSALSVKLLGDAGVWQDSERLPFPTRRAELAVLSLALAGTGGLHQEELIERLWPEAPADRAGGRLRNVLWQMRRTLGREDWRLQRHHERLLLELPAGQVDVLDLRVRAEALLAAEVPDAAGLRLVLEALSEPLLVNWQYEAWVEAEGEHNQQLVRRLEGRLREE